MKVEILFILFFLCSSLVLAQNNIYEFDEKSAIIITTSVYRDGIPYNDSDCNLTIYNPPPNENFINMSINMLNKGNGIYSYDLTGLLDYNNEIYPITLFCNDSTGYAGYDDRVGIKIGVKLYDFIIPGAILLFIAFIFFYIAFNVSGKLMNLKLFMFYIGILFIITSLFYGLAVVDQIPTNNGFKIIFQTIIGIFMLLLALLIWLQFSDKLESAANYLLGSK